MIAINTPVAGSQYKFIRSDGYYIEMPLGTKLIEDGASRNKSVSDRSRGDGGIAVGDGTYMSRKMKILYQIYSEDKDLFRNYINKLESFFREDKSPFYLILTEFNIRTEIVINKNQINQEDGLRNIVSKDNVLNIESVRSFFESLNEYGWPGGTGSRTGDSITGGTGGVGSGTGILMTPGSTVIINNPGDFDIYPKWYFVATGTTVSFSVINDTVGGGLDFDSSDFTSGAELIIDADEGTIYLNQAEVSSSLISGGFIKLIPGDNIIRYESDNGNVEMELIWRDRVFL